jgi:hypothetical protein
VADTKISALTAASAAAGTNELAINEAGTSKKLTVAQIQAFMLGTATPLIESGSGTPGTATAGSHEDHVHPGAFSTGAPALTLGTSNAAGAASTAIATDATILAFDVTVPVTQAFGDAADTGDASVAARRNHKHGMPVPRAEVSVTAQGLLVENYPRAIALNSTAFTAGRVVGGLVGLRAGDVITTLYIMLNTVGVDTTKVRLALYSASGTTLTLVASTADDHVAFNDAGNNGTTRGVALSSPYTVLTTGGYYICILSVGGTSPTLQRAINSGVMGAVGSGLVPFVYNAGNADLPSGPETFAQESVGWWVGAA